MGEVDENIIECFMCTNESGKVGLKQHLIEHHAIEKTNALDKVYALHFPGVTMNTQTAITWVDALENIEDSLTRIEENSEGTAKKEEEKYQKNKNERKHIIPVEGRRNHRDTNFVLSPSSSDTFALEEKLGIDGMARYIPEPLSIEDSELALSLNQMLAGNTSIDEDDEPVIIKETNVVFTKEPKRKNEEPIITLKHMESTICETDTSSLTEMDNLMSSDEQEELIREFQEQEMSMVDETEPKWKATDATLPRGWMYNEHIDENDKVNMTYQSPCKQEFRSRDDVSSFLASQGEKIIKVGGFKVLNKGKNKCSGLCEGNCRAFIIPKTFYSLNDKNRDRKKTKLSFNKDSKSTGNEIKEKFIKGVPKVKYVRGLKYDSAQHKRRRPVVILIEESPIEMKKTETEISKDNEILNDQHNNVIFETEDLENTAAYEEKQSLTTNKQAITRDISQKSFNTRNSSLNMTELSKETEKKEEIKPNKINAEFDDCVPKEIKEKSIEEICTLTIPSLITPTPSESMESIGKDEPIKETVERKIKIKNVNKNINIKTYFQELKENSSKRRSLFIANEPESEQASKSSREEDQKIKGEKEEALKQIPVNKRQSLPAKIETPKTKKLKSVTLSTPKENNVGLVGFDSVYKSLKCKSTPRQSLCDKRKSLLDVFETNAVKSNKKMKKNDSLTDQEIKKKNIAKLKKLQQKEVEVNKREGTYIQCSKEKCLLWRLVQEYHDPSNVPDDWVCSMNSDAENNVCGKGGQQELDDLDIVDLKYTCGSMVWGKMKGSPWWPGIVDFCPDSEEYYWIEEDINLTEPAWYHVVFFEGKGDQVSRAWIKTNDIMKMESPIEVPKFNVKSSSTKSTTKSRLMNAIKMAKDAKIMTHEERLERYSFAALFKGKWGEYSDIESDTEEAPSKKKKLVRKLFNPSSDLLSMKNQQEETKTEKQHKSNRTELVIKSSPDNTYNDDEVLDNLPPQKSDQSVKRIEVKSPKKKTNSKAEMETAFQETNEELQNNVTPKKKEKDQSIQKIDSEKANKGEKYKSLPEDQDTSSFSAPLVDSTFDHCYSKSKKRQSSEQLFEGGAKVTTIIDDIKPEELISNSNPNLDRHYPKPPLPSDVLIALSVRNLDPNNYYGASFNSIIAFLTLHFPYYNRNMEECKEMVRRAYDINTREETGKENFRIKGSLVEQLSVRIKSYVDRSRDLVRESMLIPEFLDTMVERFAHGIKANTACSFRPPYSCKMLSYLALVSLCPPSSLNQIMIFITFLFPSLQNDKTAFKNEDFEIALHSDEYIEEYYLASTGQTLFVLREGSYPIVLHSVRQFFSTKSNHDRLRKSIYAPEFVSVLLPNLETENDQKDSEES